MITRHFTSFLFVFSFAFSFSQTADFDRGCVPLKVNFTAPIGYSTFYWDFKDGASSVQQNPNNVFITPGVYNVEFRSTQTGPIIGTVTITVYPKPAPTVLTDSLPNKGCTPYRVNFRAVPNAPSGVAISNYSWTFGDGYAGTGITTSHVYTQAGYFPVGLELTSPTPSCNVTLLLDSFVFATGLNGEATASPLVACTAPHTVNFTNNLSSNTNSTITYAWSFGDGSTSTLKTPPSKTYQDTGSYQIKLIATDANGCKWILDTFVRIRNYDADFTMRDTVCAGTKVFLNGKNVLGATYLWNVNGADTTGSLNTLNTNAVYNNTGKYNVVFFALLGGCFKSKTKQIVVINPTVNIVAKPDTICDKSFTLNLGIVDSFKVDSVHWFFTYNDSVIVSKTKGGSLNTSIAFDTITWRADDTICARVFTKYGCVIEECKPFYFPAIARVSVSKVGGCAPFTVTFKNKSYSPYPINYWIIEYGDGTRDSLPGTVDSITHTYFNAGDYAARIFISNPKGCRDSSYYTIIHCCPPLFPNFQIDKANVCLHDTITITDLTPNRDSTFQWTYFADGRSISTCSNNPDPKFTFENSTGLQNIKLTISKQGCSKDSVIPVFVNGPMAKFRYKQFCDSAFARYVEFKSLSEKNTRVMYYFDDGDSSALPNPSHFYTNDGIYNVVMVAYNDTGGCLPDSFSQKIIVSKPVARFNMDTVFCYKPELTLNATSSTGLVGVGCANAFTWLIQPYETVNQTSKSGTYKLTIGDSVNFKVGVVVENAVGCKDTAFTRFKVNRITTNLQLSAKSICVPQSVVFDANVSSSLPIDTMFWNFGDGNNFGGKDSVTHFYSANQDTFRVFFYAKDVAGCTTILRDSVIANKIFAAIGLSNTSICRGDTVGISTNPNNNLKFLWDYGNGTTDTVASKKLVYDTTGVVLISLTYTDRNNAACTKKAQAALFINDAPKIGITSSVDSTLTFCFPLNIKLKYADTNSTNITDVVWTLNNQNKYYLDSIALTLSRGLNTLSLVTTNNYGCKDSSLRLFNVIGPIGDFSMDTNNICVNEQIIFTIKDTNEVASYLWDFGDGITQGDTSPIAHTYTFVPTGGSTKAKLTVYGDGKTCPYSTEKTVNLKDVFADFLRNGGDTAVCFGDTYTLDNLSKGADSYLWNFGDSRTSTVEEPNTISYQTHGTYVISLFIKNLQFGCKDTVEKVVIFHPIPESKAQGDTVCYGDSATVFALNPVDSIFYIWQPVNILSPDTGKNSSGKFETSTLVEMTAMSQYGCSKKDSVRVFVIPPPTDVVFDTIVPLGSTVVLPFEPLFGYAYNWKPDTGLSCYGCAFPQVKTILEKKIFTVSYRDTLLFCFDGESKYTIDIYPETFIKVPNTFSPNGDGKNDKIFAEGWGIKQLLYFRIYNRWSELVFETKDLKTGWDGNYRNKTQNDDVFLYKVEGIDYFDRPLKSEGFIHLMH